MEISSFLTRKASLLKTNLFHYTSFEGLQGILKSGSIWATHSHYLNDSSESRHLMDLLKEELEKRKPSLDSAESTACKRLLLFLDQSPTTHHFVASFSEDADRLSQWRAYCPRGGVSIGFKPGALTKARIAGVEVGGEEKATVAKIQYLSAEESIANAAKELLEYSSVLESTEFDEPFREEHYCDAIYNTACLYKHASFKEEREWRLIWNNHVRLDNLNYRFRTSRSLLIPYVEVKLALSGPLLRSFLSKIVIGPGPHQDLNETAVRLLLEQENCRDCTIERSTIPYRYW